MKDLVLDGVRPKGFKRHSTRVTTSSVEMTWRTPRAFLDIVEQLAGPIQLDPSADVDSSKHFAPYNCTGVFASAAALGKVLDRDGLTQTWRGFGVVYCNPPYGRSLHQWTRQADTQFGLIVGRGADPRYREDHLVMLIPARPDTRWFDALRHSANALCFWRGRLKFGGSAEAPAPFPSLVAYWGLKPKRFCNLFRPHGWCINLEKTR